MDGSREMVDAAESEPTSTLLRSGGEDYVTETPILVSFGAGDVQDFVQDIGFDAAELSVVVDQPLPAPNPGWMPEQQEMDQVNIQQVPSFEVSQMQRDRRRYKAGNKVSVQASLDGKSLWEEFYRRGTEMIVNRAGRRMFPGFSVTITGLKPKAKYSMKLEVVLASRSRFKFLNSHWLAVGAAEPQPPSEGYIHPDSPNTGAFWMRHGVSFRKLKITNNKEKPGGNVLLHSMHKYYLRLVVDEEGRSGEKKKVLSVDFPETAFIAVTAYQNEEVTQLKISNNPFAKAFRESSADIDWETAQALYGSNIGVGYSPTQQFPGTQVVSGYVPPATPWYVHPSFPQMSPSFGATFQGGGYSAAAPLTHLRHDFQWPLSMHHQHRVLDTEGYKGIPPPPLYTVSASSAALHLTDFDSVFVSTPESPTSP